VIEAAAKLSERYITDRFLPDKAIDVIDEAGARARLATQVPPPDVAELKKQQEELGEMQGPGDPRPGLRARRRAARPERELQRKIAERERGVGGGAPHAPADAQEEDVGFIVSRWTGIPVTRLKEAETERLINMEDGAPQAGRRAGQGDQGDRPGDPPLARGAQGPAPPDRQLRLRGPDGRGQDGARPGAGGVPLRRPRRR
jgi:ATP-dependent Clp protease ATP-binding subunit ClpA